ncbi:putative XTP3-transactivated protein [Paratrimastix pyriformis]|uniref:XTP3-transactivated protein n=1 Tax=Paratrimastix pyriformis TaxID=342808 RepID=A0ABQ8UM39_9EUKA|nr:putative XTP3-transactivated protein [Paratrimastix pyriformis]
MEQQQPQEEEADLSLRQLRDRVQKFVTDRDWKQFHCPRNFLLALTAEVGELCEIFQWKPDTISGLPGQPGLPGFTPAEKQHVGEEIADVLIYLAQLANCCDIDLPAAVRDKMEKNERKYPAEQVRGSNAKYNAYKTAARTEAASSSPAIASDATPQAANRDSQSASEDPGAWRWVDFVKRKSKRSVPTPILLSPRARRPGPPGPGRPGRLSQDKDLISADRHHVG